MNGEQIQKFYNFHVFYFISTGKCSHERSLYLLAESIRSPAFSTFHAAAAKNWFSSEPEQIVNMGIDCCPPNTTGNFFLQTNAISPYSLGVGGIYYDASIWNITEPNSC